MIGMAEILEQSDSDTAAGLFWVSGLCGRLLGSQPSGSKRGIFCFHALGDNVFADSLNSRFIHDTSVAHSIEIRRRVIPLKSDLGTRDGAVMHHQINQAIGRQLRQLRSLPEYKAFPLLDF